jgi:hypothetical protein
MAYLGNNNLPFDPTRTAAAPRDADRFSGNGSTTAFTLTRSVQKAVDIEVFVENVQQEPLTAYDAIGTSLTFTGAPPSGTNNVYVVYRNFDSGAQVYVPDGSITYAKLANNIRIFTTDNLTPNGNNSVFTLSEPPADANTVMVTVDGVMQRAPVHYTTTGNTITFTSSPPAGANVHVRHLGFRTTTTLTALAANSTISQPTLQTPIITGTVTGGATFQSPTINAASITGNTAIPNGSQLRFNTGSVTFDVKPVTGARDQLYMRSTYSGSTYNGLKLDYLGYVNLPVQPYFQAIYSDGTGILRNQYVPWSSIRVNRTSAYNASTRLYTCPIDGIYFVSWTVVRNNGYNAGSGDSLGIHRNGSSYFSSYYSSTVVGTVEAAAGDTIGFYYSNDSGTAYLRECYGSIWLMG